MALSGIEIFKLLPKTNCKKCGSPTCLSFAMSIAAGKKEYTECDSMSEESRQILSEALTPPIRSLMLKGRTNYKIGGETVLYRHEKRFENQPLLGLIIGSDDADLENKIRRFNETSFTRIDQILYPELICIRDKGNDREQFIASCNTAFELSDAVIMIETRDIEALEDILSRYDARKPIISSVTAENKELYFDIIKKHGCPFVISGTEIEELSEEANNFGLNDCIIDTTPQNTKDALRDQVTIRRDALINKKTAVGHPTMIDAAKLASGDRNREALIAALFINKYASVILLDTIDGDILTPLLILRMNIYSDPQRPHTTAEGIYEIGKPDEHSPVFITTNFALTYFIVSSEIENTKCSSYLLIKDTDGLSVMTAWAAGKFNAENIALLVNKCGIADKLKEKVLILPGYIAMEREALQALLPDWEVKSGPREANQLSPYLRYQRQE